MDQDSANTFPYRTVTPAQQLPSIDSTCHFAEVNNGEAVVESIVTAVEPMELDVVLGQRSSLIEQSGLSGRRKGHVPGRQSARTSSMTPRINWRLPHHVGSGEAIDVLLAAVVAKRTPVQAWGKYAMRAGGRAGTQSRREVARHSMWHGSVTNPAGALVDAGWRGIHRVFHRPAAVVSRLPRNHGRRVGRGHMLDPRRQRQSAAAVTWRSRAPTPLTVGRRAFSIPQDVAGSDAVALETAEFISRKT